MKPWVLLILIALAFPCSAQVFHFGPPKGTALYSSEKHKPSPDGFSGVRPVVIVGEKEMTIIWGDSKSAGGSEKAWKATIINKNTNTISAVVSDSSSNSSAVMLFTIDLKRGFLYMSSHKENELLGSSAASFVAVLEK